jgi:hypothetical protein
MNETTKLILQWLSGGACGAIITVIVNYLRSKTPKIRYDAIIETVYDKEAEMGKYEIEILLKSRGEDGILALDSCENAYIFRMTLKNSSSRSFDTFSFGVNFPSNMKPLVANPKPLDRLHSVKSITEINPNSHIFDLDFIVEPFNRGDSAEIQILFTKTASTDLIPQVITKEDVRLINTSVLAKSAIKLALNIAASNFMRQ